MAVEEEYERNVREAQRMADNSLSETDKAAWLRIAQQWLRMLRTLRGNETPQEDQSGSLRSRRRVTVLALSGPGGTSKFFPRRPAHGF